MASSERWMCDGIPKNGKKYPGLGGAHGPYENDSPHCGDCGLPRESSIPQSEPPLSESRGLDSKSSLPKSSIRDSTPPLSESSISNSKSPLPKSNIQDSTLPITTVILLALTGIIAVVSGATVYTIVNRCEPGLEKIDGQCIDPFRQPYQQAIQQGDKAIKNAHNYQKLEDLETTKLNLTNVIEQLNEIPQTALVYPEVAAKLEEYDRKRAEITNNIAREKAAQEKLTEVETTAQVARGQTDIANSISQLTTAKQKWQEAKNQLNEIDNTRLIANQIQQYQSEYDREIEKIDRQISQIQEENRIRNASRNTNISPQVITPPRNKPNISPQVITPPRNKPNILRQNIPYDPCAVKNPPPNCLF